MAKRQSGTLTPPSRQSDVLYRVSTYVARRSGMRDATRDERETRQQDRAPRLDRGPAVHVLQAAPGDPARLDPSRVYRVTTPGVADRLVARMKNAAGSLQVVDIATGLTAGAAHDAVTIADTASVNLNLSGQLISADVMYGGTGGNSGGSSAAARFDHAHSGVYQPAGSYQPLDQDLTDIAAIAGVQGDVIIRGASSWQRLAAGTSGQVLQTAGAGANPAWATAAGITVVDSASIDLTLTGAQLRADAIFGTTAATVAAGNHAHAGVYQPADADLTDLAAISGVQGDVIVRGSAAWQRLGAGTSGQFLQTLGTGAPPTWAAASGGAGSSDIALIRSTDFTSVASVAVDGVFSSTYDEYDLMVTVDDNTAAVTLFLQLRAAGVTAGSGNYDYSGAYNFSNAPANSGHNGAGTNGWFLASMSSGAMDSMSHVLIASPARTRKTRYEALSTYYSTPSTVTQTVTSFGGHRLATAYDGFLISGAGVSMSGNVRVYGRRKS